jgi:hypothetical protein
MATVKQLMLRIKHAKTTVSTLMRKLSVAKDRQKALEAALKKAKATEKKKPVKKAVKKRVVVKKKAASAKKRR